MQKENELASRSCTPESEYPTSNPDGVNSMMDEETDVLVNQCESAVLGDVVLRKDHGGGGIRHLICPRRLHVQQCCTGSA